MHPTETEIWNLVRLLQKIADGEAAAYANTAADNLRRLVETGVFGSLTGQSQALMQVITNDPVMKEPDHIVAKVLLTALDPERGYARLSKPQMSLRTDFSVTKVRTALKRLVEAGYFIPIPPTKKEWEDGDTAIKHRPCFEVMEAAD